MRPSLVVFDLDGTLIDSRADLASSANELLCRRGASPLPVDAVAAMVGEGARLLVARAFAAAGLPPPGDADLDEFLAIYDTRLFDRTRPYPGIDEVLAQLAGTTPLAIVTNKPTAPAHRLVDHFGWAGHFLAVLGGDGPLPRKPSPAMLRHVMALAGAAAAATLLVGDSAIDLATARAAGVRFCLARYGFGAGRVPAADLCPEDGVVDRPVDLLPWLERSA